MRSSVLAAATLAVAASAAPLAPRQASNSSSGINDAVILNYALTLEHLEATFYAEGLAKFDAAAFTAAGKADWVRFRISEIASHEADHVAFLTAGLTAAGASPVAACKYSFPYTDVPSFLAVAQILEGVGVSAYLGAAGSIMSKAYLGAAASILTVEARHSAWIRGSAQNEDAFPNAFDIPLDFNEVYSLASPFITSCPSNNTALPFKAFPTLTLSGTPAVGSSITLSAPNATGATYAAFINATGATFVPYSGNSSSIKIPAGTVGQSYVVLTSSNSTVTDDTTVAGPAVFEVAVPATEFSY